MYSLNEKYIVADISILQSLYYEISQKYDVEQLNSLVFNTLAHHPFLNELYESFYRLETSGILPYYISTDTIYDLSKRIEILKELFEKYDIYKQKEISKAAKLILKKAITNL